MSRSRKKVPGFRSCSRRRVTLRAQKKAERRAVKVSISKGKWDTLPKRREVGPSSCCGRIAKLSREDFSWELEYYREIYEEAEDQCMYVMEVLEAQPYDDLREWMRADCSLELDEKLPWSYTWLYRELYTWFPIYNDRPADPKKTREDYLIDLYRRK